MRRKTGMVILGHNYTKETTMDELVSRIAELYALMQKHDRDAKDLYRSATANRHGALLRHEILDIELSRLAWTALERIALNQIYEAASKIAADHER